MGKTSGRDVYIIGLTAGGYFLNYDTSNTTINHDYFGESYRDQMRYLYDRAKLDVNQDCIEHFTNDGRMRGKSNSSLRPQACMFVQHSWPFHKIQYSYSTFNTMIENKIKRLDKPQSNIPIGSICIDPAVRTK